MITPDPLMGVTVTLAPDERLQAEIRPDTMAFFKSHLIMAVLGGTLAGLVLVMIGNPHLWVGPVAAGLAMTVRALYLRNEAMAEVWKLTDRRLIGPGGRQIGLAEMAHIRPLLGNVQIISRSGDKYLIKYLADPASAVAAIDGARGRASHTPK
jgi:hypothetical protein